MSERRKVTDSKKHSLVHTVIGVLVVLLGAYLSFRISPWPGALVIRAMFNRNSHKTLVSMEKALPDYPVHVISNQQYRQDDKHALLDVYVPDETWAGKSNLPTVVWTHGGAWLSGDKTNAAPYFKRLANQGYVVVSLNYALAPESKYPTPVHELNAAYSFIKSKSASYHINPNKIVLAGDSAGAQLTSQMAAIMTNPDYARQVGITPSLEPSQISGAVLFCGIYKMELLAEPSPSLPKILDWGDNTTVWAYTGEKGPTGPVIEQMSAYYHVNGSFPATFISGGNADPLTDSQSIPFAEKLSTLGVQVDTLFYPSNYSAELPHEYQFTFNSDGERAFTLMFDFIAKTTK